MPDKSESGRFQVGRWWLSQRGNSPVWCRTWFDLDTRQTCRASLGVTDFESAKVELIRWFTVNGEPKLSRISDTPLAEVCARYYTKHAVNQRSAGTARRNLTIMLETLPAGLTVGDLTLDVQKAAVQKLRANGYSPWTIKRAMGTLKAATNRAWKNQEIDRPIPFESLPEGRDRDRILSIEEIARLWDAADLEHLQAFIMVLMATAARPEALLQLTTESCHFGSRTIRLKPSETEVASNKRRPTVVMPDFIVPWLEVPDGPIISFRGEPIQKINKAWRSA